ncbi:UDP-3-O-(3-hydroxymyristoyl)glucosamine N-acyltransferase [Acidobacterium sp. S8]|uniref:UDP-3-O-(3-hydroxymyristoyl)glucosamine N-acyltransferase n=1 Tax=Acidobacterium sp. S8 TaxID=1641854 RepID=UPI00131B7FDD|nr:UDP-3-O-(3-hydroxymyristoyl)glucosamine N-acyltransferase [Acidobacterium sp. S8]
MKLAELARLLGAEYRGNPDTEITGVAGIEEAGAEHATFVANPKYAPLAKKTKAGAVLVAPDFPEIEAATLRISNPYLAFARAIEIFHPAPVYAPEIHPTAVIHPSAKVGKGASIGAYAVIGEHCVIGDHATILPHVVIYPNVEIGNYFFAHAHAVVRENCRLGNGVILQNGVIVGSDGYGFAKDNAGKWRKIVQSGPTIVEDEVEIQANSCIDRASVGETRIGRGAKIDNLVQVGHGSSIGENTLLCAQVGLAGSTHVGNDAILAGQVGVAGHCHIGDRVIVTAQSGVGHDIEPGKIISGSPSYDNRQWLRVCAIMPRLPEMLRQLQRKSKETAE